MSTQRKFVYHYGNSVNLQPSKKQHIYIAQDFQQPDYRDENKEREVQMSHGIRQYPVQGNRQEGSISSRNGKRLLTNQAQKYFPLMNDKKIMETILNTEQLVERTKLYVQNIPLKSQFYQPCKCQNNYCHQVTKNPKKQNKMYNFRLPSNTGYLQNGTKFNKSLTDTWKPHEYQFQEDRQMNQEKQNKKTRNNHNVYNEVTFKPKKQLSMIEQKQQVKGNSHQDSQMNIQNQRREEYINQTNKQINSHTYHTPRTNQQKLFSSQRMSTNVKSSLNKTFQAYSNYSSNLSSASFNSKYKSKDTASLDQQKIQNNNNISTDQVIKYFKKKDKDKVHTHFSSHSPKSQHLQNYSKDKQALERENNAQNTQYFVRQCCTPFSTRIPNKQFQQIVSIKQKYSKNERHTAKVFSNEAVYPFKNVQQQFEDHRKSISSSYKSPSRQGPAYRSSSPLTPQNIKKKTRQDIFDLPNNNPSRSNLNQKYFKLNQNLPQANKDYSIQINVFNANKQIMRNHEQRSKLAQQRSNKRSGHKKHGITVLLNSFTPQKVKSNQIRISIPLGNDSQQNHIQKKRYLQVSIESKQIRRDDSLEKSKQKLKIKKTQQRFQPQNIRIPLQTQKNNLSQKISEQLNKLQALNRVDNQIYLRQSTKSKQKKPSNNRQMLKLKDKKCPRDKCQRQNQKLNTSQRERPEQKRNKNTHLSNRLQINHINNLTVHPSSLQKYQSHQTSLNQSSQVLKNDVLNTTFQFTPQKSKLNQQIVPKSHILRLQRSLQKLNQYEPNKSLQRSKQRKRIFNHNDKSSPSPVAAWKDRSRINKLYRKQVEMHNRSLQTKLYDFLVDEEVQVQRPSKNKNKFTPLKKREENATKIFQTQRKHYSSSKISNPRVTNTSTNFKYRNIDQRERSHLCRSFQSFEQSISCQTLSKGSVSKGSKESNHSQFFNKLNQQQIRKQIKKVKQHEFIGRYLTNYQIEVLMKGYMYKSIPARKWSILIIDEVYQKIRAKKEQRK